MPMAAEILTTHFIAHETDLSTAYTLWRERITASGAEIIAYSPEPHPIEDDFRLWDLRTQAAYENLRDPETMNLYELNALIDFNGIDRDIAIEFFFMEGHSDPASGFPSALGGLWDLQLRDALIDGDLSLVTVVYLGAEAVRPYMQSLFDDLLTRCHVIAYQSEMTPLEGTEHSALVGPLWMRDATLNIIGTGDSLFSPAKEAKSGWFLTADPVEKVEELLPEIIEPGIVVIGRIVVEPF